MENQEISAGSSGAGRGRNNMIILAVVAVLLIAANFAGGMIIAKRVDTYVKQRVENLPVVLQYDSISVNPIFGRASFEDVIVELEDGVTLRFSTVKVSPAMDVLKSVYKNEDITGLQSIKVTAHEGLVDIKERPRLAKVKELSISLDGGVDFQDPKTIMDSSQFIKFSINDVSVNVPELPLALNIGSSHAYKLTTLDELSMEVAYTASSKEVEVRSIKLKSPLISSEAKSLYRFRLDDKGDPLLSFVSTDETFNMTPQGMKLGFKALTGKYTLPDITAKASYSAAIADDMRITLDGMSTMSINGFSVEFGGDALSKIEQAIGNPLDEGKITVQSLELNQRYEGGRVIVHDSTIQTDPYFRLSMEADLDIGGALQNVPEIELNLLRLTMTDHASFISSLIGEVEAGMGFTLPRDGSGAIILEMKGNLAESDELQIKGRDY